MSPTDTSNDQPTDTASATDADVCPVCGTTLDVGRWHPTVSYTDDTGVYSLVRLCSSSCRAEWETDHAPE